MVDAMEQAFRNNQVTTPSEDASQAKLTTDAIYMSAADAISLKLAAKAAKVFNLFNFTTCENYTNPTFKERGKIGSFFLLCVSQPYATSG